MRVPDIEVIPGLAAIILCGGQSKRMGTRKEWLTLGNETLLARLVRIISTVADPVIIATGIDSPVPPLPSKVKIVRDQQRDRGPLAGMQSGFAALSRHSNRAFVVSCDTPLITPWAIKQLDDQLGDAVGVVPVISNAVQPLCAIYRLEVAESLDKLLTEPQRGPRDLEHLVPIAQWTPRASSLEIAEKSPFQSFNSPSEWEKIRMSFDR